MVVVFRLNDRNLKKEKVKGNPEKYSIVENEAIDFARRFTDSPIRRAGMGLGTGAD
jgi:hypothetical protein